MTLMIDAALSWRSVRSRPVQSLIPIIVTALALGLALAVWVLGDAARRGIVQASDPFGVLVVGPKGDGQQLVLNSILLQGLPLGTIPADIYESLKADARVQLAVPLAFGDNLGGAPIIGTSEEFFELRTSLSAPPAFRVREGRIFSEELEAVLGSTAAARLQLRVGDHFQSQHGVHTGLASDTHDALFTVVGILDASGTAYDRAVYTSVESVWHVHEGEDPLDTFALDHEDEHEGDHEGLTAILVKPVSFSDQNTIWQDFYTGTTAQAVFPGQELGGIFDLLRQGEQILGVVGVLVMAIAALVIFLAVYSATLQRGRDLAVLRSLGAGRHNLFRTVLGESLVISVIGAFAGHFVGYGTAAAIASAYSTQNGLPLPVRFLADLEPLLWGVPILVGIVAGMLPALLAYRVDVSEQLTPS